MPWKPNVGDETPSEELTDLEQGGSKFGPPKAEPPLSQSMLSLNRWVAGEEAI